MSLRKLLCRTVTLPLTLAYFCCFAVLLTLLAIPLGIEALWNYAAPPQLIASFRAAGDCIDDSRNWWICRFHLNRWFDVKTLVANPHEQGEQRSSNH